MMFLLVLEFIKCLWELIGLLSNYHNRSHYASINLHNLHPIFTQEQLASSLRTTFLSIPALHAVIIMDIEKLCSNIHSSLHSNPIASTQLNSPSSHWSVDSKGFLLLNNKIYVHDSSDLQLCILQYKHNHPISSHFRQNWTMELVWCEYIWLKFHDFVKFYIKSCTTCMCSKSQRHHPYGLLKQLPKTLELNIHGLHWEATKV